MQHASHSHELWLRLALLRPDNISCIPQVLTYYRRRDGQITNGRSTMEKAWRGIIEKHRQLHPEVVGAIERQSRSNLCRYLAATAYENKEYIWSGSGRYMRVSKVRRISSFGPTAAIWWQVHC